MERERERSTRAQCHPAMLNSPVDVSGHGACAHFQWDNS